MKPASPAFRGLGHDGCAKILLASVLLLSAGAAAVAAAPARAEDPLAEAKVPNRAGGGVVRVGFPRSRAALKSIGDVRIKTIFVDFNDAPASRPPQAVFGLLSPGAENFWKVVSYGKLNTTLDPVFTWLRMSKPSDQYGWTALTAALHRVYLQEAVDLALAAGVDFSTSDTVAVIANPDANHLTKGPTYVAGGIVARDKTFAVAITSGRDLGHWGYKWLNHEGGHMMGLPDLYAFTGAGHRFVGDFSLMGLISGSAPEYLGWERWLLGWLDDNQVICPPRGTSTSVLTPIETAGGRKIVVVPTGATTALVVEHRRPIGFDHALATAGPLVYLVDTSIAGGHGAVKVLPLDETDMRKLNALLRVGQSVAHAGVTVKFLSAAADTVTVEVMRP